MMRMATTKMVIFICRSECCGLCLVIVLVVMTMNRDDDDDDDDDNDANEIAILACLLQETRDNEACFLLVDQCF